MAREKPSPIKDLPSIPWHRKSLLYRFGPEALEKHFDIAMVIFEKNASTEAFANLLKSNPVDSIVEVGKRLEWLKTHESEPTYEPIRFRILFAYLSFFLALGRVPIQRELFELEAKIEHLKAQPRVRQSLFSIPSQEVFAEASKIQIGKQRDRRTRSGQLNGMGLRLLDGKKLQKYSTAYESVRLKRKNPEYSDFVHEVHGTDRPSLLEITISDFFEFLSAPFAIDPYAIWKSNLISTEYFLSLLRSEIPKISKKETVQARCLYDLFMILGAYFQYLSDGFDPRDLSGKLSEQSPSKAELLTALAKETKIDLSPCAPDFLGGSDFDFHKAVNKPFSSSSREKGELPSYFEFWFMNPAIRRIVIQTERIPANYTKAFEGFSYACSTSKAEPQSPVGVLIDHSPVFRTVISALNPCWKNHEAAVYFDAISMSDSG